MENNFKKKITLKLAQDLDLEKKSPQFYQIDKLKKEIAELEETIKSHNSDSFEKDFFISKKKVLEEKLKNIITSN